MGEAYLVLRQDVQWRLFRQSHQCLLNVSILRPNKCLELIRVEQVLPLTHLLAEVLKEPLPVLNNLCFSVALNNIIFISYQCLFRRNRRNVAARPPIAQSNPQIIEVVEPPLSFKRTKFVAPFHNIEHCFRALLQRRVHDSDRNWRILVCLVHN
jgi:hypothetical protein